MSRKRAAGRKGTVDEYDYLIASIGRLVIRVEEKSGRSRLALTDLTILTDVADALTLIRHLVATHRELATDLQSAVIKYRALLSSSIDEAWRDRETILAGVLESGGMGLQGDPSKSLELIRPAIKDWKGLGFLSSE